MPALFSFTQVREDLAKHTAGLSHEQLWREIDRASIGFHLKHIAGSVDRLATYLVGQQLSEQQLASMRSENVADKGLNELLARVDSSLRDAEEKLRAINPETLYDARSVGRKSLPTTVLGLIVHLAEHTQRHLGQAITMCKIVRQSG